MIEIVGSPRAVITAAGRAIGASVTLCALATAQLWPGSPRAFLVAEGDPFAHSIGHVACGDLSGDHRGDAAIVVDGELVVALAAAGFGVQIHVPTPGDGTVTDCKLVTEPGRSTPSLVFCVIGGDTPGLYRLDFDGTGTPRVRKLDDTDWAAVGSLVAATTTRGVELFGLVVDGEKVVRGTLTVDGYSNGLPIGLDASCERIRVSAWGDADDLCVFASKLADIHVLGIDGSPREILTTAATLSDFDVGYWQELGHGRLVRILRGPLDVSMLQSVDPGGAIVQTIDLLNLHPRMVLDDVFQRGALDVVAIATTTALGFASFSGIGAEPGQFLFDVQGSVLFGFDSPQFASATEFSNLGLDDLDGDGDRDVVFCDTATNTLRVQPSWAIDEIERAPHVESFTPIYSYQVMGGQKFEFVFSPSSSVPLSPTHIELALYQKKLVGGQLQYLLVESGVFTASPSSTIPGAFSTGDVLVFATYDGPEGTDADYVAAARWLHANATNTGYDWYGVDGFTEFHHHRTPNPHYPGYYLGGTVGGTNPLPIVIGSGITAPGQLPPLPPPPGGGG